MSKAPKKYECLQCGFVSNKHQSIKFPIMSFAVCYKCRGKVKERQEWLDWLYDAQTKVFTKAAGTTESA